VLSRAWASLDDRRRALLRLLSRFDPTIDQRTRFYQPTERDNAGIRVSDDDLLANPYLIYERSRLSPRPRRRPDDRPRGVPGGPDQGSHPLPGGLLGSSRQPTFACGRP
jgi:hypothetical protein